MIHKICEFFYYIFITFSIHKKYIKITSCCKKFVVKCIKLNKGGNYMKSRVKWFNNEKGFGFLENGGQEDIFVHYSAIDCVGYKTLAEGDEVEFNLINTVKGLQAKDVRNVTVVSSDNLCI